MKLFHVQAINNITTTASSNSNLTETLFRKFSSIPPKEKTSKMIQNNATV